ncbi:MAG: nucleotidyl transferase AbiEii/AbiGii toxin family protein [Gammaproteobacteria bacterium]|nr:nucleotidyl transferase AbiEii/AbiGii toxin family protein [Gammaproteobacteria bacterium]
MLNKKDLIELISVTRQHINLNDAVIEKDYYVTQVIHALSGIENEYFRLVFCGGTCLAKAHRIVHRMSEDVDFKIQVKKMDVAFSKARLMKELKEFRFYIKSKLILPNLITGDPIVRNEGRYSKIEIDYPSAFPVNTGLRPHILLEFTLSDIRLAVEELSVKTLIEDNISNTTIFTPSSTQCVSVEETAIEKWVGLTRRIIAIERKRHHDDSTLVRHVYDLNSIKSADRINANFFTLAKAIVTNDAKQFKNQHPEYSIDPGAEIKQSLTLLKNKPLWKERYQEFIETMVYDDTAALEYENVIKILENISARVIDSLHQ